MILTFAPAHTRKTSASRSRCGPARSHAQLLDNTYPLDFNRIEGKISKLEGKPYLLYPFGTFLFIQSLPPYLHLKDFAVSIHIMLLNPEYIVCAYVHYYLRVHVTTLLRTKNGEHCV